MVKKYASIRAATAQDVPAIAAIEQMSYSHPWSAAQFYNELENQVSFTDLCSVDNEVAGYLCAWMVVGELEILRVTVRNDYRRLGLATQLLENAFVRFAGPQLQSAWLEVREDNYAAIALYEQLGFTVQGRRESYYPDGEAALLMVRQFMECYDLGVVHEKS